MFSSNSELYLRTTSANLISERLLRGGFLKFIMKMNISDHAGKFICGAFSDCLRV